MQQQQTRLEDLPGTEYVPVVFENNPSYYPHYYALLHTTGVVVKGKAVAILHCYLPLQGHDHTVPHYWLLREASQEEKQQHEGLISTEPDDPTRHRDWMPVNLSGGKTVCQSEEQIWEEIDRLTKNPQDYPEFG